ncbi:MAG: T9SS C-terminal target domain-containing protein [Bacteroidetes bacterium]|nr:MAG: T9SS C-terminal target domain-containing protein [Bacteroidota bacterium]
MKLVSLSAIALMLGVCSLHAQITITQADLPATNDTLRYSAAVPLNGYDFQQTGENLHWDFSDLNFQTQGLENYRSVSSINFLMGLFFGSGTMAIKITDMLPLDDFDMEVEDFYAVFHKNAQQYTQDGFFFIFSGLPIPLKYNQKDFVYQLPLNFSDNDSTAFSGNLSLGDTIHFERKGYRINQVDGWGTVETPYGEFDCLRVKTTLYESDSLFWASLPEPIVLKRTTIQYKWLAKNEKLPVMEANYLQFDGENEIFLGVRYRDIYRKPQQTEAPLASFTADITEAEINEAVTFSNLSTPGHDVNTYQWTFDPDHVEFLFQTGSTSPEPIVGFTQPGIYSVTLSAHNETASDTHHKPGYITVSDIDDPVSIAGLSAKKPSAYVSPDGSQLIINYPDQSGWANITDMHGREVYATGNVSFDTFQADISALSSGVYIVTLFSGQSSAVLLQRKIVKP